MQGFLSRIFKRFCRQLHKVGEQDVAQTQLLGEKGFINKALDSLPGLFYVLDDKMEYVLVNQSFIDQLGYTWEEVRQMNPLDFYLEEDHERISGAIEKAFSDGRASITSRVRTKGGEAPYYYLTGTLFEQDGKNYILGTGIDITDKVRSEEKVRESLHEKEILLSEVHHRVKNNLALVSGLMQLQAFQVNDELVYKYLNDNQSRIKSIALIHEQLYQHHDFTFIRLAEQTSKLVEHISTSMRSEAEIRVDLQLDEVVLNINQAVPYTLILNELMTNAYKHAFKGRNLGAIRIALSQKGSLVTLIIEDDGLGWQQHVDFNQPGSHGLTLVKTLADQLDGLFRIDDVPKGTRIKLQFEKVDLLKGASSNLA